MDLKTKRNTLIGISVVAAAFAGGAIYSAGGDDTDSVEIVTVADPQTDVDDVAESTTTTVAETIPTTTTAPPATTTPEPAPTTTTTEPPPMPTEPVEIIAPEWDGHGPPPTIQGPYGPVYPDGYVDPADVMPPVPDLPPPGPEITFSEPDD